MRLSIIALASLLLCLFAYHAAVALESIAAAEEKIAEAAVGVSCAPGMQLPVDPR